MTDICSHRIYNDTESHNESPKYDQGPGLAALSQAFPGSVIEFSPNDDGAGGVFCINHNRIVVPTHSMEGRRFFPEEIVALAKGEISVEDIENLVDGDASSENVEGFIQEYRLKYIPVWENWMPGYLDDLTGNGSITINSIAPRQLIELSGTPLLSVASAPNTVIGYIVRNIGSLRVVRVEIDHPNFQIGENDEILVIDPSSFRAGETVEVECTVTDVSGNTVQNSFSLHIEE